MRECCSHSSLNGSSLFLWLISATAPGFPVFGPRDVHRSSRTVDDLMGLCLACFAWKDGSISSEVAWQGDATFSIVTGRNAPSLEFRHDPSSAIWLVSTRWHPVLGRSHPVRAIPHPLEKPILMAQPHIPVGSMENWLFSICTDAINMCRSVSNGRPPENPTWNLSI